MIDVPPGQILDDWERWFGTVERIGLSMTATLRVHTERIHQFELNDDDLKRFDVVVFAVRWVLLGRLALEQPR